MTEHELLLGLCTTMSRLATAQEELAVASAKVNENTTAMIELTTGLQTQLLRLTDVISRLIDSTETRH